MINGRKVISAFIFYNELDLLDIKLHEMDSFVDWFVLVESTRAFNNQSKSLYYEENKDRFSEFHHKMVHVIVDDAPDTSNSWAIEFHVRNATLRGVNLVPGINDDDWVILSDLDEIVRASKFEETVFYPGTVYKFDLTFRYYKFNCRAVNDGWDAPIMVEKRYFNDPQHTRHIGDHPVLSKMPMVRVMGAGWHFSYMGGVDKIVSKINTGGHQELNTDHYKNRERLERKARFGEDLFDRKNQYWEYINDKNYPKYVNQHPEIFESYFEPLKKYPFRCIIPFTGNYEGLNWSIESMHKEAVKFSTVKVPIRVYNNSHQKLDYSKLRVNSGMFELFDPYEPYLLPQVLNHAVKWAKDDGDEFMLWMHDDAAIKTNGLKILLDKYEQVKDQKWGCIFLASEADVCTIYNIRMFFEENLWYEPILFPMYFMDCHFMRIFRLRGWTIEKALDDGPESYVIHKQSHTIKENDRIRRINDFLQPFNRSMFNKIWGGDPGFETNQDPTAGGMA